MHSKVTAARQQAAAFERVLEALARELIDATDTELLEAATDLGMDPTMRGSAAFIGLKYPAIPRKSDFFELPATHALRIHDDRRPLELRDSSPAAPTRKRRRKPPRSGGEGA